MFALDLLRLIPQRFKQQALEALVDFISEQAKKFAGDEIAARIKRLRSDAAFQEAFETGLQRAAQRFIEEYEIEDEDLVAAIAADEDFFQNKQIRSALLTILKKPGSYLAEEQATLAQSFTTVLPQRKNRERVDRAVTYLLKCLAEELWQLPELRPIYSLQFQRMTVEAARQQVELQKAQLQALTGLNVGVREALLQLTDAIAERKLLPSGDVPALPEPKRVYHNLPQPDYGTFIGRDEELKQVHALLSSGSRHFLVTIDGIGGIGKSALALEVAHRYLRDHDRLPPEERFEAIVWTSAKSSVLTADGIIPRQQITRTLDDIYNTILVTLEREDITRPRYEGSDELVHHALARQRTLLIVDNLETVDDECVNTFLRELPAPTQAIVTTRHRIDVAYPVRLMGMPKEDGLVFIAQECAKKNVILTDAEAEKLYDRTGGVPLAVVWSVAQMGYGHSTATVLHRLGQPTSNIAGYCFEGVTKRIQDKPAHKLLMALSLFATSASREALGYVTTLPELDQDDGLVKLERLSLVNKRDNRFWMLPLTKKYTLNELMQQPEFEKQTRERWTQYFVNFMSQYEVGYEAAVDRNSKDYDSVGREFQNILAVLEWCHSTEKWSEFAQLVHLLSYFLYMRGLWMERQQLIKRGLFASRASGNNTLEGMLLCDQVWVLIRQGEYEQASKQLAKAEQITRSLTTTHILPVYVLLEKGDMAKRQRDFNTAHKWLTVAKECEGEEFKRHLIRVDYYIGQCEIAQAKCAAAQERLKVALQQARQLGWERAIAHISMELGHIAIMNEDLDQAQRIYSDTLQFLLKFDDKPETANYQLHLALFAEKIGDIPRAVSLAQQALHDFQRQEQYQRAMRTETLLARLKG